MSRLRAFLAREGEMTLGAYVAILATMFVGGVAFGVALGHLIWA